MSYKLDDGYTLGFIGCGNLGSAILSGILTASNDTSNEVARPGKILVSVTRKESVDRLTGRLEQLQTGIQVNVRINNEYVAKECDVLVLGCKPYSLIDIINSNQVKPYLSGKVIVSLCAGVRISTMYMSLSNGWVKGTEYPLIIRAMSNTPAKVNAAMTMIALPCTDSDHVANEHISNLLNGDTADLNILSSLSHVFSQIGKCIELPEKQIDTFTAIAGSGPAFIFQYIESMIDGAVLMGLPSYQAREICAQTVFGSAKMLLQDLNKSTYDFKQQVTTPAGCTINGLMVLEEGSIRSLVAKAIEKATNVASGLK